MKRPPFVPPVYTATRWSVRIGGAGVCFVGTFVQAHDEALARSKKNSKLTFYVTPIDNEESAS